MCICMVVVGFASDGKQHLNEQQLQSPVSIDMQDKAADYNQMKANKVKRSQALLKEMMINKALSNKIDNGPTEASHDEKSNKSRF